MLKTFRFCPFCAAALVRKNIHGKRMKACPECGFIDFQNARPTAGAVIVNEKNEVLLARRARPPHKDMWNLPGGFLEKWEHPREGAIRELKEETGLDIEITGFLDIHIGNYNDPEQGFFQTFNVYYAARIGKGKLKAADDTSELRYFPLDELPKMAFECDRQAIEDFGEKL
jgi:8-oxo-dGTP diphosphatase